MEDRWNIEEIENGLTFEAWVTPRSHKNRIEIVPEHPIRIRLEAPPLKGKANQQLIAFLAKQLGVKRSQIKIISGDKARKKRILIRHIRKEDLVDRLRSFV